MMKECSPARGPLEHSDSLESRDNPFLPGGDLSREAEDLLSRATIIRDNFYLNEEEKRTLRENQLIQEQLLEQQQQQQQQQQNEIQQQQPQKPAKGGKHVHIVDHLDGNSNPSSPPGHEQLNNSTVPEVVEERVTAQTTQAVAASPTSPVADTPKVNGNVGDHPASVSPDTVNITIPDVDGQTRSEGNGGAPDSVGNNPDGLQVQGVDEKKRPNKCCTVM